MINLVQLFYLQNDSVYAYESLIYFEMEEQIQKLNILMEASHLNIHAIRTLCRENPNLIELSGKRLQVWSIFLLGNEFKESDYQIELYEPSETCGEQHVLEADVHRTRAEIETLRTPETRKLIKIILQKFCLDHEIQYKQGMNEVTDIFFFHFFFYFICYYRRF